MSAARRGRPDHRSAPSSSGAQQSSTKRTSVRALAAVAVLLGLFGSSAIIRGASANPVGGTSSTSPSLAQVQDMYAQDLVDRINAERAARSNAQVPIPQLQVNSSLAADAQAWANQIAASGAVSDPTLPPCPEQSDQVCALAANSGDSGYGFWPGDGSDGMNGDYMQSAPHRQNMLEAAYDQVGVGVTCSGGQAFTVEIFGYAYGELSTAYAREGAQNVLQGNPVSPTPEVAGPQTGDPVYCPGQTYGPSGEVTSTGGQYPYPYPVPTVPNEAGNVGTPVVGIAATPDSEGYWIVRSDGSVISRGDAESYGSMAGDPLAAPITHLVPTPDGRGYWMVGADGGIFSFGDAGFYGSMGGQHLNAPIVDLAPTPNGKGYWLVGSDGGVFAFGDAGFKGSMGGQPLNAPVVGLAPDRATGGYWLVGSDGGVYSFDAPFEGSAGALQLNAPVDGISANGSGNGYWLVGSDGSVFAFGAAEFEGSGGNLTLAAPIVGLAPDLATGGYWLVGSDGGIFAFDAPYFGRAGNPAGG
jgi:uncharacterized protein YkwD